MKIGIIGCRFNTYRFIQQLNRDKISISCIISRKFNKKTNINSEFTSLVPIARSLGIKIILSENYTISKKLINQIIKQKLDIIFCVGWQRILPDDILNAPSYGVLGMHGSNYILPKGRGRSPQVWTIIKGSKKYFAHIIKYDSGIDSGKILKIKSVDVTEFDTAADLQIKSQIIFNQFVYKNIRNLKKLILKSKNQKNERAYYFKKRSESDGLINWNLQVSKISNFIRAQTLPYPGAFSFIAEKKIKIWKCNVFDTCLSFKKPYGTIVDILNSSEILVQCKGGILRISKLSTKKLKIGMRFISIKPKNKH